MLLLILVTAVFTLAIPAKPSRSPSRLYESKYIRRQSSDFEDLDTYIYQLNTARFALDLILQGQGPVSCDPATLIEIYNEQSYDGRYAEQLLCAAAAGIDLFPDVQQAFDGVSTALTGLQGLRDPLHLGGSQTEVTCEEIDVAVLYQAGLEGDAIRDLICSAEDSPPGTSASSSLAVVETSSSSATASTSSPSAALTSPSSISSIAVTTSQAPTTSVSVTPGSATPAITTSSSFSHNTSSASILITNVFPSSVSVTASQSNATASTGQGSSDGMTNVNSTSASSPSITFTTIWTALLTTSLLNSGSNASFTSAQPSRNVTSSLGDAGTGVPSSIANATTSPATAANSASTVIAATSNNSTLSIGGSLATMIGSESGIAVTLRPVQTTNASLSVTTPASDATTRVVGSPVMTTRSPVNSTALPVTSTQSSSTFTDQGLKGTTAWTSASSNMTIAPDFTATDEGRSGTLTNTPSAGLTSFLTRNGSSSTNTPMSALPPTVSMSSSLPRVSGDASISSTSTALSASASCFPALETRNGTVYVRPTSTVVLTRTISICDC